MEIEISIVEDDVGTNNSIEEAVKKDEGGAFKEEMLADEIDSSNEEDIWRSRWERIKNALAAARNSEKQDPAESLAIKINPSAIFNCLNAEGNSLLHFAAFNGKDDILRLLLDYVPDHLIAAQNDWGDAPLHMAIGAKRSTATEMLIRRTRDLPNIEVKNQILRMKNKHGNTALHEAVLNGHVKGPRSVGRRFGARVLDE
ncbi:hypothetical protein NL676_000586 [Syzygium grande]|nr:hypothetical protein NL676_000586 [Syzygium grande]